MLPLTMTNRLGRSIDRARLIAAELRKPGSKGRDYLREQVSIIYRRARLLRLTIGFTFFSVLLASVLIVSLFLTALLYWEGGLGVSLIFIGCMTSLVISLICFLFDIHLSLVALRLELNQVKLDLA